MSVSSERVPISKRKRFELFDRDKFTCQYCGKQPPMVRLVIDHRIPIKEGGHNEDDNLITSCEECNQGKGAKVIGIGNTPTHQDALLAQERLEAIQASKLATKAAKAREALRQTMLGYYARLTGEESIDRAVLTSLCKLVYEFDFDTVAAWMDMAYTVVGSRRGKFIAYVCACARNTRSAA